MVLVGFWLAMNLLFFLYERLLGVAELLYVRKIEKRLRSVFKKKRLVFVRYKSLFELFRINAGYAGIHQQG